VSVSLTADTVHTRIRTLCMYCPLLYQMSKMLECRNRNYTLETSLTRHVVPSEHSECRDDARSSGTIEAAHIHLTIPCVPVTGHGGPSSPLGRSFLLFFLLGHLVYPQSLLSFHPQITHCNKKQNAFPPCYSSCFSRPRFAQFRCIGSIPEVYRESDSVLSSSRHSTSFGI
jgi:hypothetical protein